MSRFVLLDSERLGMASKPDHKSGVKDCLDWIADLRYSGSDQVIIATSNVRHLARFPGVDARDWEMIA